MADVRDGVSRSAQRSEHNRHDRLLVARFATNDSYREELAQASELVNSCTDCARLAEDVRLLSRAVAKLPAPDRPRSFRIDRDQAARLRGSRFDRFLRRLAAPGIPGLRPVAGVALSIGLALAVIGTGFPQAAYPAFAPLPGSEAQPVGPPATPVDQIDRSSTSDPFSGGQAPEATEDSGQVTIGGGPSSPAEAGETFTTTEDVQPWAVDQSVDLGRLLLVYGGVTLAVISFGVLLLAWFARRREDPLLR